MPNAEYYWRNKERLQAQAREYYQANADERRAYTADWIAANPDRARAASKKHMKLRVFKMRGLVRTLKNSPCVDCGVTRAPRLMHFHHVDPQNKEFNVSQVGHYSKRRIMAEIDKCVLLCAGCHLKRHPRKPKCSNQS